MSTFINVKKYGDFDMPYTVCVMMHTEKFNKGDLLSEFYAIEGISSTDGLTEKQLNTVTEDFICFLEMKGFRNMKLNTVIFSD